MSEPPESIKIKMLADAGFTPIPLQDKYLKLVAFVQEIAKNESIDNIYEVQAYAVLKSVGEA